MRLIEEQEAIRHLTKARMINDSRPMTDIFAEIPTVCDIEQIRKEIESIEDFEVVNGALYVREYDVVQIIDRYTKGGMSPEVKEHYEQLAEYYDKKKGGAI